MSLPMSTFDAKGEAASVGEEEEFNVDSVHALVTG